jgi:N utilization substance protein A
VRVEVKSKEFGRIATQNAKNVILQKIREEERKVIFDEYNSNEKHEMKALVKAEADAIITNYPDIAVEIVKNA